jgi:hypothetical protein
MYWANTENQSMKYKKAHDHTPLPKASVRSALQLQGIKAGIKPTLWIIHISLGYVHVRYTVLAKVKVLQVLQQLLAVEPFSVRLLSPMPPWPFLLLLLLSVQSSVPGVDDSGV